MLRRVFAAVIAMTLAASCGGEKRHIDVRHPPKILQALATLVPSTPLTVSEISSSCAQGEQLVVMSACEAAIAPSSSMMRKAHLYVVKGGFAFVEYTPAASSDAIRLKLTSDEPAHIPIRRSGGALRVTCFQCAIEVRAE